MPVTGLLISFRAKRRARNSLLFTKARLRWVGSADIAPSRDDVIDDRALDAACLRGPYGESDLRTATRSAATLAQSPGRRVACADRTFPEGCRLSFIQGRRPDAFP